MTFLINNITTVALSVVLLIQLIYWIVDKIKTKSDIEKLRKEMQDTISDIIKKMEIGIDGVKRHDKNNQQNSVNIVSELLKNQEENNEKRIKIVEEKIENIKKNLSHENNTKAN